MIRNAFVLNDLINSKLVWSFQGCQESLPDTKAAGKDYCPRRYSFYNTAPSLGLPSGNPLIA